MLEDRKVLLKLNECLEGNLSVATVTIVNTEGSTPRGIGSSMLVDGDGNILEGTIGGGILEETAKRDAADYINRKKSSLVNYDLGSDDQSENILAMNCGGQVSLFIKTYCGRDKLIIAGAGHISEKLSKMASILGYSITVLDNRKERINDNLFPEVENLILGDIVEKLKDISIDNNTYIIIVTHGHEDDQDVLEAVVHSDAKYIGMIGSKNKVKGNFDNLIKKGCRKEELSSIYSPIGLNIGGKTPEEIALSILAEIQAAKYDRQVPNLYKGRSEF